MRPSSCTMVIPILGFPAILLLLLLLHMAVAAEDEDKMKLEWKDMKLHPALKRSDGEKKYLTEDLAPRKGTGGMSIRACVRKEYRTLAEKERTALHDAFNRLKKAPVKTGTAGQQITEYDALVGYHRYDVATAAHFGASFLPWHREFLCRIERALLKHNINVCLPYVDWTMDQMLPVPSDSAIWTSKYLGNNYGSVISGLAANWKVYPSDCTSTSPTLYRDMVRDGTGKSYLFSDAGVADILGKTRYEDICVPYSYAVESTHNSVHMFVGGHMSRLSCAPNDPTFYFHHCFVDCIWQEFRNKRQKTNQETEYPKDRTMVDVEYWFDAPMKPFEGLRNIDGLSKNYTKQYVCEPRPVACKVQKDCKSEILWCYNGRCTAKIREGGHCEKLPHEACYSENCISPKNVNGICKC